MTQEHTYFGPLSAPPPGLNEIESSMDMLNFGDGNQSIKQLDRAMHPDGSSLIELWMKSRITPEAQPFLDHIMADGIRRGKFAVPFLTTKKINAAEALVAANMITSIALSGEGRSEFQKILGGVSAFVRQPMNYFKGQQRRSTYGQ